MSSDPYRYFRVEAAELLERIGQDLLSLDREAATSERLPSLLRHLHTLKGAAGVVKQSAIADVAHAMEDQLASVRGTADPIPRATIDLLLGHLDAITLLTGRLGETTAASDKPATVAEVGIDHTSTTTRINISDVDALLNAISASVTQLGSLRPTLMQIEQLRSSVELLTRQLSAPIRDGGRHASQAIEGARATCREVDDACRRIDRELDIGIDRIGRELGEVYAAAEGLRLVPASTAFTTLERSAREAAHGVGKHVTFSTRGGSVRVDGQVLAVAQEALLHAVRNSVVHGIEDAVTRGAAGKPPDGNIAVDVTRRGRRVVFGCQDDGRGLDVEGVRRALRAQTHLDVTDEVELLKRLPGSGISTAVQVTHVAGRGVGLDVARDVAVRLGGDLRLQAWAGQGFRLELDVPLSVASFEGLVVESAGVRGAIAIDAVEHTYRLRSNEITHHADGRVVLHQGQLIPFVQLSELLGRSQQSSASAFPTLVVRSEMGPAAIGVERLVGARTIVARSLPEAAVTTAIVMGASLNTLGHPELVFDANGLAQEARALRTPVASRQTSTPCILVVDDSLTTRMMEQSILESAGYDVDLATSGEEGMERALAKPHALFLVDVEMPGIDGFTFVERTRAEPTLRHTPAVLVSSRGSDADMARGRDAGAAAYVVKGRFDQRELLAIIRDLVRSE